MKNTHHPDLHDAARLLVATLYYELPGDKGEAYWTNQIASHYGLFRSQCLAKQADAVQLPARIRTQARVLLDFLGLGDLNVLRQSYVLARIENDLALLVGAPDPVVVALLSQQQARTDAELDRAVYGVAVLATRPSLSQVYLPLDGPITDTHLSALFCSCPPVAPGDPADFPQWWNAAAWGTILAIGSSLFVCILCLLFR